MRRYSLFISIIPLLFSLHSEAQTVGGPSYGTGAAKGFITACAGSPSASPNIQQFTVFGNELTTDMEIGAPQYFELSLTAEGGYQSSVVIPAVGGVINNVIVYARSSLAAPVGNISGRCITSTSGLRTIDPLLTGTIYTLPTLSALLQQTLLGGTLTKPINFTGTANTYTWTNDTPAIGLAASGLGYIAPFTAINTGNTPIVATITATPIVAGFAYAANYNDGTVSIINTATNTAAGSITVGTNPYGISMSDDYTRLYVANQGSNDVSVINTQTNAVVATIPVGKSPGGVASNSTNTSAYAANETDNTVSVINLPINREVFIIKVGAKPVNVLVRQDDFRVYVANSGSNDISVIDASDNEVLKDIPVGNGPSGMALSPDGNILYVANTADNSVTSINTVYNSVISTIQSAQFASPTGIAISPDGSLLYVTNYASGTVSVVSTVTNKVTATITVGNMPLGVTASANANLLYVTNSGSNTMSVINTATNTVDAIVPVGSAPFSLGSFVKASTGCSGAPVKITITVNPESYPNITAAGTPSPLNTIYGTASSSTIFTVSGVNMMAGILVTPPAGFEVSANDITFSGTVTVGAAGTIAPTTVYIRLAASTHVGNYSGNITLSSINAGDVDLPMPESTVTKAPLTIVADDKSKYFGTDNPALTVTYNGFVNNDGPANLTTQPVITTTAVTTSAPGQYPISAAGATSPDYSISYTPGILTVSPPIFIPNTFTPNADGINDTWNIKDLNVNPNCSVRVYNRYGENVYSSIGYGQAWDGTYKGSPLPSGTYYYIIDLKNGSSLLSGYLVIVR